MDDNEAKYPRVVWEGVAKRLVQVDHETLVVEMINGQDSLGQVRWAQARHMDAVEGVLRAALLTAIRYREGQ